MPKKKKDKSSAKSAKTATVTAPEEEKIIPEAPAPTPERVQDEDLREIKIVLKHYENIVAAYPTARIFTKCQYLGNDLGETEKATLTDDSVLQACHEFKFTCDVNSPKDLDLLVSSPVMFSVFQEAIILQGSKLFQEPINDEQVIKPESLDSIDSAISLYEALTGDIVERIESTLTPKIVKPKVGKKNKKKKTSESKTSKKSSKSSKDSRSRKKSGDKSSKKSSKKGSSRDELSKTKIGKNEPLVMGNCCLDLLPLIFGASSFTEFLKINPPQTHCDDNMVTYKNIPGFVVSVSIDKVIKFPCKIDVLTLTIESIHNIPALMNSEMEYQICINLPSVNSSKNTILIKDGLLKTAPAAEQCKYWPLIPKDTTNITKYKINPDIQSIKNQSNVSLDVISQKTTPRIEFNCLKRNLLLKDGLFALHDQVKNHRRILLEIYCCSKNQNTGSLLNIPSSSKVKLKKKSKTNAIERKDSEGFLHLMAIVDVSSLLYPGVTKIRVATPLTTYHNDEVLNMTGLEKSFFFPAPKKVVAEELPAAPSKTKVKKGGGKKSKSSKGSKSSKSSKKSGKSGKSSKSSKGSKKTDPVKSEPVDLKDSLPAEPVPLPPPEPSKKVFNENGETTFIIIEIELTQPLTEKRKIEDLQRSLQKLIQSKPQTPKVSLDFQLAEKFKQNTIKEIIYDINKRYIEYTQEKSLCHCENQADFLTYLRRTGGYQMFVYTLMQLASLLVQNKLNLIDDITGINPQQKLAEEIFSKLITDANQALNKLSVMCMDVVEIHNKDIDSLLFYAKEATEMRNVTLAEKYYLQRLHYDFDNPNCWFDYAVFQLECNEIQKSFMCIQEALVRDMYHRNSLLLNGILLYERKQEKDAEICLITLMVQQPRWLEGWAVLYLYYKNVENEEGMDLCLDMTKKYLDDPRTPIDYFMQTDDLTWTTSICPNRIFFRVAALLLKMRVFSWVENALTHELRDYGSIHYLLAVICYYKKNFKHAVDHLQRARTFHGSDYAVVSLTGHCHMALGQFSEAEKEYSYILESFERPDDAHLLYLNYAKVLKNRQMARKLLLLASKNHPTPYTWMSCGILYFEQNDLISAEECFSESTMLDNSLSECWAYLTLINLKLSRISEAEICYGIALKNNLGNVGLHEEIKKEFEKHKSNIN